jgi:hypothetical protein
LVTNILVLYILKPRDIPTGSSGTLKYNFTVVKGCLSFISLYCKGEHPSNSKTSPQKIETILVMKKIYSTTG